MTQINSLINFVSGTKALSNEVNQNFEAVRTSHNDTDKRTSMIEDARGIDARNYNNGALSALTIAEAWK